MKPLGHRVLIQPDAQDTELESGLVLLEDRYHIPTTGTVVAVNDKGPTWLHEARQRAFGECLDALDAFSHRHDLQEVRKRLVERMTADYNPVREIHVGDRVAFSITAGSDVFHEGQQYILVNEDDLVLVLETAVA